MSYKFSTGSVRRGDVYFEDDRDGEPTYIDFGQDSITLRPSGSQILHAAPHAVGIGTTSPDPDELLTIDGANGVHEANIQFREGGSNRAKIGINDSDNLVFHNQTVNKHVVFKVNDQGTTREGLRLDGAVTAVVVNEGSDSLVDFRVESDNNTHMLFVDGANDKIGINTATPNSGLHINTSVTLAGKAITQDYTATAADHMIFLNATSVDIVVSLPTAVGIMGRQYILKRVDSSGNVVTIDPSGSQTIEGLGTKVLENQNSIVVVSDDNNWWIISEFITPP